MNKAELKVKVILATILLLGFVVRIWGIDFGLPYLYQTDEGKIIYTAFYAAAHKLHPDTFVHSTLIAYLLIPVYGIYFLIGRFAGNFSSTFDFYVSFLSDPTTFVILGRMMMVLLSLGSVVMTYKIGRRMFGERVGLLSAALLSFNFMFVKESHYIKDEVLAAFLLLVFFFFVFLANAKGRKKDMYLAGIFLGLAVSAKYIYLPVALILLVVWFWKRASGRVLLFSLVLSGVSFIVTNPYVVLDFGRFFNQTLDLFYFGRGIGSALMDGRPALVQFLTVHLPGGLSWSLYLVSLFGFSICFASMRGRKGVLLSLMVFLLFLGIVAGGGNFARWAIPLVPFLVLLTGIVIDRLRFRLLLSGFILVILVLPNLLGLVRFDNWLTWEDTRTIAKDWIEENISSGERIAVEGTVKAEVPSYLAPPLILGNERLVELRDEARASGQEGLNLDAQIEAYRGRVGYDLVGTPRLERPFDEENGRYVSIDSVDYYLDKKVVYLITSSWARSRHLEEADRFGSSVEEHYELIRSFKPTVALDREPHAWGINVEDVKAFPLLTDGYSGPEIRIYKMKDISEI